MKKILTILLALIIALAGFVYWSDHAEAPTESEQTNARALAETYVRQNIGSLSPEPAVLGGTFYVTNIDTRDGSGTVWYEDGHIALVADFEYIVDKYGVTVTSFEVRL